MRFKLLFIIVIIFFIGAPAALAVSPADEKTIMEAQKYGIGGVSKSVTEFLSPWLSYEEQAEVLNEDTEHAYFYTPFLLVASDAREKSLNKESIKISDSQTVIDLYAGYFVFSAAISGDEPGFADKIKVTLRQEKITVNASQMIMGQPQKFFENIYASTEPFYRVNCYFYFENKKFDLTKPVFLTIVSKNKQERCFYFDLAKLM